MNTDQFTHLLSEKTPFTTTSTEQLLLCFQSRYTIFISRWSLLWNWRRTHFFQDVSPTLAQNVRVEVPSWKQPTRCNSMSTFIDPAVGKFVSAFDPSWVIKEQCAAVKHPVSNWGGGQCLAQGHFDMQLWGERGSNRGPCGCGTTTLSSCSAAFDHLVWPSSARRVLRSHRNIA